MPTVGRSRTVPPCLSRCRPDAFAPPQRHNVWSIHGTHGGSASSASSRPRGAASAASGSSAVCRGRSSDLDLANGYVQHVQHVQLVQRSSNCLSARLDFFSFRLHSVRSVRARSVRDIQQAFNEQTVMNLIWQAWNPRFYTLKQSSNVTWTHALCLVAGTSFLEALSFFSSTFSGSRCFEVAFFFSSGRLTV